MTILRLRKVHNAGFEIIYYIRQRFCCRSLANQFALYPSVAMMLECFGFAEAR